jgi:hypothetical protein
MNNEKAFIFPHSKLTSNASSSKFSSWTDAMILSARALHCESHLTKTVDELKATATAIADADEKKAALAAIPEGDLNIRRLFLSSIYELAANWNPARS